MIGTKLVDRYEVVGELGRGGMGVVYRARDPLLNRDVAVKVIPPSMLTPQSEERFQREAQLVAQMNHPSIVSIFDIGRHEGSLFFLMPVVTGANLRTFLSASPRSLGDVIEVAIQVADALDYSHSRGVVHRDIKPANIMIAREEGSTVRVRVMDFGLAHTASESRLTKTGTLVGTVAYLSPEQVA
jgi:Serine/threonine protein kinase